ncbi:LysM peptidoglycan-binding domain-containing protein [Tenacibaculum salmonis]|uniref:LysM peptidoglycan-binding domain-containing protein n=1 Tax=Tenacibaculum sp. P3-BQ1 TaxID=3232310 RepID=UPI0034DDE99C
MKKEITVALLLSIGLYSFSQDKKLPAGWDIVSLDDKPAYMNLITGTISRTYPRKPALIKPLEKQKFDSTITHTVKKGETLSVISRKYDLKLSRLYRLNSMTNFDTLKIGQEIVIGYGQSEAEKIAFFNKKTKINTKKPQTQTKAVLNKQYEKRFALIIEKDTDIKSENKVTNKYHIVTESETLYGISIHYKLSIDKLKTLNKLKDNTIFLGQKLIVK